MKKRQKVVQDEIAAVIDAMEADRRLTVWHLALLAGIIVLALRQGRTSEVKVSRSRLMALSHINTLPTYHKYFKDLQVIGYIYYRPSYHPLVRSEVDIRKQPH